LIGLHARCMPAARATIERSTPPWDWAIMVFHEDSA
jgi:hypothetical protein